MADAELEVYETWLYGRLNGDATLAARAPGGVHNRLVVQGSTAVPVVRFQQLSGIDINPIGAPRCYVVATYLVIAATRDTAAGGVVSYKPLHAAMQRVTELCHRQSVTSSSVRIDMEREQEYSMGPYIVEGVPWYDLRQMYRVWLQRV